MITANTPRAVYIDTTHAPMRQRDGCPPCTHDCAQGDRCPARVGKLTEADLDARELERVTLPMELAADDASRALVAADNRFLGWYVFGLFLAVLVLSTLAYLTQEIAR